MLIKIGTRGSELAVVQANMVADELLALNPNIKVEIIKIKTTGDILHSENLTKIGGKAVFLKEIEEQLIAGNIDCAVHSAKDVPAFLHNNLQISGVLKRAKPTDCMLSEKYNSVAEMPKGATVGTGSIRRAVQLLKINPNIEIKPIRGNISTRINKMQSNDFDAIVLASAALYRLNLQHLIKQEFSVKEILPAVGQGIICVETRKSDGAINRLVANISDEETFFQLKAERHFMQKVEGNCTMPMGAYVYKNSEDSYRIDAMFSKTDADAKFASCNFNAQDMEKKVSEVAEVLTKD